jgi:restriction endonuclease S subunit
MSRLPVEKLGKHTSLISSGSTPLGGSQVYLTNGPVLFIRSQNVLMNQLDLESAVYISDEMDRRIGRTRLQADDVLLNITGASIGRVATFDGQSKRANVNQHVCVIRPDPHVLNARYLSCFIATPEFQRSIQRAQVGGTRQALTFSQIADFEVPLPPVAEQRRIAEVLDRAEALRAKRRAVLAQLDILTQSMFLDLFGNQGDRETESLQDLCELITDGTHYTPEYSDSGTLFLSARNVTSGYVDWEDVKFIPESLHRELRKRVSPRLNDILLAKNGTTGVAAIVDRDCIFDIYVSLALLRPKDDVLPVYLHGALNSPTCSKQFRAALKGIGVPNLHLNEIRHARIPHPSLPLQREYASRIAAVEKLKGAHRSSLAGLGGLFAVLQQRAFRGEL